MKHYQLIVLYLLSLSLSSCAQNDRYIDSFKDTKAYELAKAVAKEDLEAIERIVKEDLTLMEFTESTYGSNVLVLSVNIEKFKSFEKLLELGANPNFINPYTKYSVLIMAIQPFGSQFEWRKDNRYIELLLHYGADPNYSVENDFTNEKGHSIFSKSPLVAASNLDLAAVKILVNNGADPYMKLGEKQTTGFSEAVSAVKFDIIDFYIDSLNVDVFQPVRVRKKDSLFVQDYIKKFMAYTEGSEGYERKQNLIKKLEGMGVDFKNYDYKL